MNKQKPMRRGAGVLMPVFSLPSPYGIGTFGRAAYDFVDFLHSAGQKYWQVLPLGPTGYGDSPYQSFSSFAGNPYFIDLDMLIEEGLLTKEEVTAIHWGDRADSIDYGLLYEKRFPLLATAFSLAKVEGSAEYKTFLEENKSWLPQYCLFMKNKSGYASGACCHSIFDKTTSSDQAGACCHSIFDKTTSSDQAGACCHGIFDTRSSDHERFWEVCQFYFFRQWQRLKSYANDLGIKIIGDIPIYAALDSADMSANPEQFLLDADGKPTYIAGVPPDGFSAEGQLWGNPLYDWSQMERDGFAWWISRLSHACKLYDILRLDHFIGFVRYYAIPAESKSAKYGEWRQALGRELIEALQKDVKDICIIAEDLGEVTEEVTKLRLDVGYPGMRPMIYAFGADGTHDFLPCNVEKNMVIYGGTHDNETLMGYFLSCSENERSFAKEYLNIEKDEDIAWALIRAGYAANAALTIFQMQDYLELGNEARINAPASVGGQNWRWRLLPDQLTKGLAKKMNRLCFVYGR